MKKTIRIFIAAMLIACVMPFTYTSANADWFPDDTTATETTPASGLYNPPISIAEVTSDDTLESFKNDDLPVQAILSLDENGKVVGENGEEICDLSVALDEYLQKKILPVFRVTETSADAFLTWMKTDRRITDASVTSSSPEAVKKIKSVYPFLRGIIEFDLYRQRRVCANLRSARKYGDLRQRKIYSGSIQNGMGKDGRRR